MKSESNIYDHQSSRSLNLDIPKPRKIGERIEAQTRGEDWPLHAVSSSCCLDMAANHLLVAARIRHSCQNSHHGIVDLCSKSRVFANAVKCFSFELPIYIKDSHEIYKWDLVNVKNFPSSGTLEPFMTTWNTLFFEKMLTCGTKVGLWRCWHGKNACMWDL
jgi:hypothetical protein